MGNSRVLQKATKELTKAKAPKTSEDIIYDPMGQWNHEGNNTRIALNSDSKSITMKPNPATGKPIPFPVMAVPNIGQPQMMYPGQDYVFPGADYVDEYPQMKRGGLKKSKYSKSIMAINKLFAKHDLFKKPGKHKIYDPNAKYYQDGGEYGMPLGTGVSQNFIGNKDEFNVGGIPNLPLRDNRVNYNAYVNGFEPMTKMDDGGYIETELTDEEIQAYKEGGWVVEYVD